MTLLPLSARHLIARAARSLRRTAGAIDLASILVGVLVMGILGSIVAASVFVVIPWAQDSAAKSSLDAVKTAQSVSRVKDGKFQDWAGLLASKYVTGSGTVDTVVNAAGDCWVSAAKSSTGTSFYKTSRDNTVLDDKGGPPDTNWCVSSTRALADPVVNLAINPSFEAAGVSPVTVRRNLLNNPSFETGVAGWQGYGVSVDYTQSAARNFAGTKSMRLAPTTNGYVGAQIQLASVTPGTSYTFSSQLYREAGTGGSSLAIEWRDAANAAISMPSSNTNAVLGAWQRFSITGVAPAGATQAFAVVRYTGAAAGTDVMYADAVMLETATSSRPYFDGTVASTDPDLTNSWAGVADASFSLQRGVDAAGVGMNGGAWAQGFQSKVWSSSGPTSLQMRGDGPHNDQFLEMANVLPLQANKVYTFVAKVKTTATISDPNQLRLRYNISGIGDIWGSPGFTGPAGVYDFRMSFSTSGMTAVNFFRIMNGIDSPGLITYWDDMMLVEIPDLSHPYTGPYFDGSSANGVWNGAPNASSSTGWIRR